MTTLEKMAFFFKILNHALSKINWQFWMTEKYGKVVLWEGKR
jgi:hypothetical protein